MNHGCVYFNLFQSPCSLSTSFILQSITKPARKLQKPAQPTPNNFFCLLHREKHFQSTQPASLVKLVSHIPSSYQHLLTSTRRLQAQQTPKTAKMVSAMSSDLKLESRPPGLRVCVIQNRPPGLRICAIQSRPPGLRICTIQNGAASSASELQGHAWNYYCSIQSSDI
jgi:hypothetical protein